MSDRRLQLVVRTPAQVVVDAAVRGVTAEDGSGRFGMRPGCEPVVAALVPSVLTYVDDGGTERFVVVGSGVLHARPEQVDVAVREAVPSDSLEAVDDELMASVSQRREGEDAMHEAFRSLYRRLVTTMADEGRRP